MKESLIWKNIKLVKYEEKYFEYIYDKYQDYNSRFLFTNDLNIVSKEKMYDNFRKKLNTIYHEFMIIFSVSKNMPIGFIYSYDYNMPNGYLYLAIFVEEDSRNNIAGAEAGIIFLNYLFSKYPLRKVYCTVYEYNNMSLKFLKNSGFNIEGLLKKHKYFNGKYYNMYILSMFRKDIENLNKRLKYEN